MWDQLCLATENNGVFGTEKETEAEQGAAVVQGTWNMLWYQEQVEREKKRKIRNENISVAKMLEDRLRNWTRLKQICLHMLMFD